MVTGRREGRSRHRFPPLGASVVGRGDLGVLELVKLGAGVGGGA